MARVILRDHSGAEVAAADVLLGGEGPAPPAADWQTPTVRPNKKIGQTIAYPLADTWYEDCTFTESPNSGSSRWNDMQRVTIVRPRMSCPTMCRGWRDVWFGGAPGNLINAGPRTDGNDLLQIKKGTASPDHVTFAWIDFHDVTRPDSTKHPDGIQLMTGKYITIGGCDFRNYQMGCQPIMLRDAGSSAGGGPIEDTLITECDFSGVQHYYSIRVAGNDEEASSGRYVPTRTTLNKIDLGGKNALVDAAARDKGLWYSDIIGGEVKIYARTAAQMVALEALKDTNE